VSLIDAVRGFLVAHKARTESVPFLSLFDLNLAAKADRSPEYLRELRITRDRLPSLHDRMVSDITHLELESVLSPLSPGARNPVMRYLRAVFFFGVKRGYLTENPITTLDFAKRKRKEIETIPNDKVRAMLEHALEHDLSSTSTGSSAVTRTQALGVA
jgi:site-specific recombinase XerD